MQAHSDMQAHARTRARARAPSRQYVRANKNTRPNKQVQGGGLTELDMSGKEGLAVAVAVARLLERSAATLTRLDVR
jgi:hypothetical protein